MTKVLVTGGSGFVGTNIVEYYFNLGCNVLNIDIAPPRNPAHQNLWRKVDIRDGNPLGDTIRDFSPNVIINMAARTDLGGKSLRDYTTNTDGVKELIEAATNSPSLERVIFASSMLVCKLGYSPQNDVDYCPTTLYGESKVIGEQYVKSLAKGRFPWTIVRPTSLWGPWFDIPYKIFFMAVSKRMYMHPKGRKIHRSYGFILNSVHQIAQIASCQKKELVDEKIVYIADYQPIELLSWAQLISSCFGVKSPREVPLVFLRGLALVGDLLKRVGMRNPPLSTFRLNNLLTDAVFNMSTLEKISEKIPYDVKKSVEITVDWIRKNNLKQ